MTDKELAQAYQDATIRSLELDLKLNPEGNPPLSFTGMPALTVDSQAWSLMSKIHRRFLEIYGDPDKQKKIDQMNVKRRRMNR